MAVWTEIPNSSLESGAPVRSVDGVALRDNPVAIAEGATGAPKITDDALSTTATSIGKDWVINRFSQVTGNEIGSICISATFTAKDGTIAGSSLQYISAYNSSTGWVGTSLGMSGTWRSLGGSSSFNRLVTPGSYPTCLYVRIA